jgi:peptidoglycan hydrolase-like protein with peptidoglycan-binding domain
MRGENIRTWQVRMRERGWSITVDGAYGLQSATVCRAFQREHRLAVDGIVGPATWRAAWEAPIR